MKLNLVEENKRVLFLTCNTENLIGGHYARLGQIVIHSILHEGPAFPFLPKAVYYYLIGDSSISLKRGRGTTGNRVCGEKGEYMYICEKIDHLQYNMILQDGVRKSAH